MLWRSVFDRKGDKVQYQDKIRKYFSDATVRVLENAGIKTLQDIIDRRAVGVMQVDGIGKKRFWEISDVMINVCKQSGKEWQWNPDIKLNMMKPKGDDSMGKKASKKSAEKMAIYRIIDTVTMQVVFVGYTKELTKGTLKAKLELLKKEAANRDISLDSRYVLDYIPVNDKKKLMKEREKFYRAYQPMFGAEIAVSHEVEKVTEDDNIRWKPFFSELHDGIVANRNILRALEHSDRASVLKETGWWNMMKDVFDSPETERALHSIGETGADVTVENVFVKISQNDDAEENLLSMRTAFIQLVNEKLEGKYKPLAVLNTGSEPQAEEMQEEANPAAAEEPKQEETEPKKMNFLNTAPATIADLKGFKPDVPDEDEPEFILESDDETDDELKTEKSELAEIIEELRRDDMNTLAETLKETEKTEDSVPDDDSESEQFSHFDGNPNHVQKSTETEEEKENFDFQPDAHWNEIISTVRQRVPEYVSRTLADSNAVISGDTLLITAQNPLFMTIFRKTENAVILADAVTAVLGKFYKIRAKCVNDGIYVPETEIHAESVPDFEETEPDMGTAADEWTENKPESHNAPQSEPILWGKFKQAGDEYQIQKLVRQKQWEMFFENCVGYYQKNSADFFVQDAVTGTRISYHMPFFVESCLVNGRRENLFFAVADNIDDYAVLFHISAFYGVKIMILHDVQSESAIYAYENEDEFVRFCRRHDVFRMSSNAPHMPYAEYQIQVSETGNLSFTQNAPKTDFTEICFRFLHSGRELLENKIRKLYFSQWGEHDAHTARERLQEIDRKMQNFQEQQNYFRNQETNIQNQINQIRSEIR